MDNEENSLEQAAPIEDTTLTGKQKKFADEYIGAAHFNATKAAILAGYSEKSAYQIGFANLRKVEIREYIKSRLSEVTLTENEVLARLTEHANASLADVLDENGAFDFNRLRESGNDHLLKKLKIRKTTRRTKDGEEIEDVTHEFEMHDAQAATVHLGRFHKLFAERIEHTAKDGKDLIITFDFHSQAKLNGSE